MYNFIMFMCRFRHLFSCKAPRQPVKRARKTERGRRARAIACFCETRAREQASKKSATSADPEAYTKARACLALYGRTAHEKIIYYGL